MSLTATRNGNGGTTKASDGPKATLVPKDVRTPSARIYPRLHFYGLPQEIRDLIYEQVFEDDSEYKNSEFLEPLLTSRQLCHEAYALAWSHCTFTLDCSRVNPSQVGVLFSRFLVAPSAAGPPVLDRGIRRLQIETDDLSKLLSPLYDLSCERNLPHMQVLEFVSAAAINASTLVSLLLFASYFKPHAARFEIPRHVFLSTSQLRTWMSGSHGSRVLRPVNFRSRTTSDTWEIAYVNATEDEPQHYTYSKKLDSADLDITKLHATSARQPKKDSLIVKLRASPSHLQRLN